ncbi:energy transducer TonB [Vibrio rumoiensis]|uniref:TonB C-terminal domain-containing protein n=1 Tax=Vibrio rumoiensis 1S-45 TaxID=1188252 RepID=A0A1E5E4B5_9VIBR|nr:energy transducer TonB [Vibrio rumoiensis]OEF27609.1 hypothetical protein A1QC_06140 [Vibrio rumoiensis 1S-45]
MNLKRYTFAAVVSISAHAAAMVQFNEQKAFAMPVGTNSTSVSVNLVSMVRSEPVLSHPKKTTVQESAITPVPKATKETVQKTTRTANAKPVSKPAIKKAAIQKATPKKAVTPSVNQPSKTVKTASTTQQKQNITKPQPKSKNAEITPHVQKSQSIAAKQGASQEPLMIEKPDFLSPPKKPRYPRLAQRKGIEGTATYEIWLDENGRQVKQSLISSSGAAMLDKAALDAIKKWKFSPQKINGTSIAHRVQVPIRFKLD